MAPQPRKKIVGGSFGFRKPPLKDFLSGEEASLPTHLRRDGAAPERRGREIMKAPASAAQESQRNNSHGSASVSPSTSSMANSEASTATGRACNWVAKVSALPSRSAASRSARTRSRNRAW